MSDEPNQDPIEDAQADAPTGASPRARVIAAAGAAVLLLAIVGVVVATGSSDEIEITNECIQAWNDDPIAPVQDGTHAFTGHGYRATLATRVDDEGNLLDVENGEAPADDPEARCAVVFAAPQIDFEPDFGVRVLNENGWVSLAQAQKLGIPQIEAMQAEAVATANASLLSNGLLAQDDS